MIHDGLTSWLQEEQRKSKKQWHMTESHDGCRKGRGRGRRRNNDIWQTHMAAAGRAEEEEETMIHDGLTSWLREEQRKKKKKQWYMTESHDDWRKSRGRGRSNDIWLIDIMTAGRAEEEEETMTYDGITDGCRKSRGRRRRSNDIWRTDIVTAGRAEEEEETMIYNGLTMMTAVRTEEEEETMI